MFILHKELRLKNNVQRPCQKIQNTRRQVHCLIIHLPERRLHFSLFSAFISLRTRHFCTSCFWNLGLTTGCNLVALWRKCIRTSAMEHRHYRWCPSMKQTRMWKKTEESSSENNEVDSKSGADSSKNVNEPENVPEETREISVTWWLTWSSVLCSYMWWPMAKPVVSR